ncbi:hypothetical protein [Ornithinimicrobium cryptoxanthini]|nr:hypothetical protein [Ornithinimicrobium cryptoxanthini]
MLRSRSGYEWAAVPAPQNRPVSPGWAAVPAPQKLPHGIPIGG